MIKVAFIDDGILPIFEGICLSHYVVAQNMVVPCFPKKTKHSHATTCAAIFIQMLGFLIEEFEIISIGVLDKMGSGALIDLRTAVFWACENGVKIINLSLGGTHFFQQQMLIECVNYAASKDVIIVAAQSNDNVFTYPASFSNVVGVKSVNAHIDKDLVLNSSFAFDGIEFCANSVFNLPIYYETGHKTETSNSFATPVVSALIAKLCLSHADLNVFDAKHMLCEQFDLQSDYIQPTVFDWSIKSTLICFHRCNISYRCIHNTSIVSRYDFIGDIPKDFPDTVIRNQNSSKCDTLIVYGRNERADTLEKLDVLSKHFRYALFIDDNAANIKTRFPIPVHTNILNLDVIDNPILLNDELDTQFDIPVIKCLISKEHDLLFEHLEVLFDIVSVFREKGYNCTVLTNLDIGLLFGFIVQRNNISLTMINKLIKFHNIDLLLVAICEEDCIMKNFLFDLTFKFAQNNFDASNYIELIENAFE